MPQPLKRIFDLTLTIPALLFLWPLLLLVALAVRIGVGPRIVFAQVRAGKNTSRFAILKFCTMTDARDRAGHLLPDSQRLTRVGRFLRVMSLDELPQLWNVLRGELSLVGPRPLLIEYLPRYTPEQMRRHKVMPGITGLAQVSGRNGLSWARKFELDVEYVDRWSLWLDITILARTVWAVIRRDGISFRDHATAPEFTGTASLMEGPNA